MTERSVRQRVCQSTTPSCTALTDRLFDFHVGMFERQNDCFSDCIDVDSRIQTLRSLRSFVEVGKLTNFKTEKKSFPKKNNNTSVKIKPVRQRAKSKAVREQPLG